MKPENPYHLEPHPSSIKLQCNRQSIIRKTTSYMASTTLVVCTAYLVGMIAIPEFIETEVVYFLDFLMNRQPCSGDYRFAWHGLTLALGGIVISVLTLATIQITQDEKAK